VEILWKKDGKKSGKIPMWKGWKTEGIIHRSVGIKKRQKTREFRAMSIFSTVSTAIRRIRKNNKK
jgi:hypothetical protein